MAIYNDLTEKEIIQSLVEDKMLLEAKVKPHLRRDTHLSSQ